MDAKQYLGKHVLVKIDRPMGSRHPEHGYFYPVNYGYLEGIRSEDGEDLDAYVLGVFEPVEQFEGRCIAVIRRLNDADDKLVVVPEGAAYSDEQIRALVEFQERYFEGNILR